MRRARRNRTHQGDATAHAGRKVTMSHFSVLVIGAEPGEVGEALAPWMEYSCGKPDDRYLEFFEDEDCDVDETTGKRGYWQNPNSRWDWFVPGGRYANVFSQVLLSEKSEPFFRVSSRKFFGFRRGHAASFLTCPA